MYKFKEFLKRLIPYFYDRFKMDWRLIIISFISFFLILLSLFIAPEIVFAVLMFTTIFIFLRIEIVNITIKNEQEELKALITELKTEKKVIDEHLASGGSIALEDRMFLETYNETLEELQNELNALPQSKLF